MSPLHFIPVSEEPLLDERLCENCARPDDDLAPVRRRYVVPPAWDTEGSDRVLDDIETWCFSCRSIYPHQPVP